MKEIEISGANRFETFSRTRGAGRGIIVRDGKILLSLETVSGWWLVPGGGMEEGETAESCCVREVEEETGYIVQPLREFLTLYEYYEEYRYISHYFLCEITGAGRMRLTDAEKRRGLEPEWLPLEDAVRIFSRHQEYTDVSEEHKAKCQAKLDVLLEQNADLCTAIDQLMECYKKGEKVMKVYKQMKMYNDPALNPVLYGQK